MIDHHLINWLEWKQNAPRLTLRRGSAPTALHPVNWLDSSRTKRAAPAVHLGRRGSLRVSNYDHNAAHFRRRGSLPYELGRKLPINANDPSNSISYSYQFWSIFLRWFRLVIGIVPAPVIAMDCSKLDLGSRRGSAPSELLRNTSASIASCWIQLRDRIKVKVSLQLTNCNLEKATFWPILMYQPKFWPILMNFDQFWCKIW